MESKSSYLFNTQPLLDAIRASGIEPPPASIIKPTGNKPLRFSSSGKRCDDKGWLYISDNGKLATWGAWGKGKLGSINSCPDYDNRKSTNSPFCAGNNFQGYKKSAASKTRTDAEKIECAQKKWGRAGNCTISDYLNTKQIPGAAKFVKVVREKYEMNNDVEVFKTLIPVYLGDELIALEQIFKIPGSDKFEKRATGPTVGGYLIFGNPETSPVVFVSEGFATGYTVFEALEEKCAVVVSFGKDNLINIVDALKSLRKKVIFAADRNKNRCGEIAARKAAKKIHGSFVVLPDCRKKDFNDLGVQKTRAQLKRVVEGLINDNIKAANLMSKIMDIKISNSSLSSLIAQASQEKITNDFKHLGIVVAKIGGHGRLFIDNKSELLAQMLGVPNKTWCSLLSLLPGAAYAQAKINGKGGRRGIAIPLDCIDVSEFAPVPEQVIAEHELETSRAEQGSASDPVSQPKAVVSAYELRNEFNVDVEDHGDAWIDPALQEQIEREDAILQQSDSLIRFGAK